MIHKMIIFIFFLSAMIGCKSPPTVEESVYSGNPIFDGWYADPEAVVLNSEYWIFPTYSARYEEQVFLDAFSSRDLITWEKHPRIIDTTIISWAKEAIWAPSAIEHQGKYYLFFSANDVQRKGGPMWDEENPNNQSGGIGIAVADQVGGPYQDYLGEPLISDFHNDAQPIDQFVFMDADGQIYIMYGGWGHCNIGRLSDDLKRIIPWEDGNLFHEITPSGYVEGPFMFERKGQYYFMWSEGGWTNSTYKVAYAVSDKPTGPFEKVGTILEQDSTIATGAGHNSVLHIPNTDEYIMVYHRRPIPNEGRDHRVTCLDRLEFDENGRIKEIKMTWEGVPSRPIQD